MFRAPGRSAKIARSASGDWRRQRRAQSAPARLSSKPNNSVDLIRSVSFSGPVALSDGTRWRHDACEDDEAHRTCLEHKSLQLSQYVHDPLRIRLDRNELVRAPHELERKPWLVLHFLFSQFVQLSASRGERVFAIGGHELKPRP